MKRLSVVLLLLVAVLLCACSKQVDGVAYTVRDDQSYAFTDAPYSWHMEKGYGVVSVAGEPCLRAATRQYYWLQGGEEFPITLNKAGEPVQITLPFGQEMHAADYAAITTAMYYHDLGSRIRGRFPWVGALLALLFVAIGVLVVWHAPKLVPDGAARRVRIYRITGLGVAVIALLALLAMLLIY